ncbi:MULTISPECIES: hypothetical protein [Streptomyces]|uniref:Uncharacterized protein n=1 Tax=Streptomyces luteosporeus TaxID=173856 RepID=A0ABN3TQN2_9ACTN
MIHRPLRALLSGLLAAVALAGGGVVAGGGQVARAAAACAADATAPGHRGRPSGDPVPVRRADGRVEQFQLFYDDPAPGSYLPFVWHRAQQEPGGAYGEWERVSATPVGPKLYQVTAIENALGRMEVFFPSLGVFCHTAEGAGTDGWGPTEGFGLAPSPYHGGIVVFREAGGRLDAFASAGGTDAMQTRTQDPATGRWGPVAGLGALPDPFAGLSQPSSVAQLPDGRLHLVVREWNRDRFWQVTERAHLESWEPWQLCADSRCA